MSATIVARSESSFIVQVEIPYASSMLDFEQTIQDQLNQAGVVATREALQQFDTDGAPITVGSIKFTSKGRLPKEYQTPYGVATVARHVYQSSQGGKTYCPLDRDARIVVSSTPRFARMIAHKYAEFGSARVIADPERNHGRAVARSFVRNVADAVAAVALAREALGVRAARVRRAGGHRDRGPGRDLHADGEGDVAGGDGRDPGLLQRGRRAAAHRLHGGHARVGA